MDNLAWELCTWEFWIALSTVMFMMPWDDMEEEDGTDDDDDGGCKELDVEAGCAGLSGPGRCVEE